MIRIITIEREYGSGAAEIAELLAQQLGWKLWDKELTEEIARLANCPKNVVEVREERTDPLYYRLFKSFLHGSYEGSLNAHKLNLVDSETIFKLTQRVVCDVVRSGNCVIVGRGSHHFLRNNKDTLRVFLFAPREDKVRRLIARGKTEKEAEQLVDTVDQERTVFIRKYFEVEWPNFPVFDTMINTRIGDDSVVQAIIDFMNRLSTRVPAEVQTPA